ncbi:hypothetical protein K443DRAFT_122913 [Laccaria amethystina LaAM-08-1]|uniref:Uncharacterized protein n=1 Tax=Laccaria amethystina LaAM-08-1 TaxID=1095629 RepID=A0A0C9X572_9AGAR|nr:hypothetical protein K443DRAFT_122913 [Laccaria amethystina LaAM-08-1]
MPCICRRTSVRGHRIQRYFSPLTTRATFSPERLLSPPPGALRKTFPLIESVSEAIAKEGRESAICSQLGISEVEHSNIQDFLHDLINNHLKLKVSYSKQTGSAVRTVFSKAKEQYPCFESQDETLENMLKQLLKKASKSFFI